MTVLVVEEGSGVAVSAATVLTDVTLLLCVCSDVAL